MLSVRQQARTLDMMVWWRPKDKWARHKWGGHILLVLGVSCSNLFRERFFEWAIQGHKPKCHPHLCRPHVCSSDDAGVCETQHVFYSNLGLATQQQKLLSSPWLGVFGANKPTCLLLRRRVFVHRRRYGWLDTTARVTARALCCPQSYISKSTWRQGIGSLVRNSYVSTLCPVVICPYLCTSDVPKPLEALRGAQEPSSARASAQWRSGGYSSL